MTSVLTFQFYTLGRKSVDGRRGIAAACLQSLTDHNSREKISNDMEIWKKKKNTQHINTDLSHNNITYKKMDYAAINKIKDQAKETNARSNAVGSFEMVFDFTMSVEEFDEAAHREMVMQYLDEIKLTDRFELLEMVLHLDETDGGIREPKPHFHLIFSGFSKKENKFAVNDFFNPKGEAKIMRDKKGNILYKKIKNGKDRGKYQLDENGSKIPRMEAKRVNGAQLIQDSWAEYLKKNDFIYSNKKKFASVLQFPNRIWRSFDTETKENIYYVREIETLLYEQRSIGADPQDIEATEKELEERVNRILGIARAAEEEYKQQQKKTLSPRLQR